jgi:hypothetical protein
MPAGPLCCAALAAALGSSSCASVAFTRDSETSGRFESTGLAVTLFSIDLPSRAIDIARENASDARQPNLVIDESWVFPYLGPVDFLLDIIGVRYAHVSGSWGFDPDDPRAATAR